MQGKIRHMCRPRGQALVEFALIVPILMLILVGIADTGLLTRPIIRWLTPVVRVVVYWSLTVRFCSGRDVHLVWSRL